MDHFVLEPESYSEGGRVVWSPSSSSRGQAFLRALHPDPMRVDALVVAGVRAEERSLQTNPQLSFRLGGTWCPSLSPTAGPFPPAAWRLSTAGGRAGPGRQHRARGLGWSRLVPSLGSFPSPCCLPSPPLCFFGPSSPLRLPLRRLCPHRTPSRCPVPPTTLNTNDNKLSVLSLQSMNDRFEYL